MNDLDKDKLLYRPKLRPERDWLSDGEIIDFPIVPQPLEDEPVNDEPSKIVEDLKELEEIFHLLPEDAQHMRESITKLKQRMIVAFPDGTWTETYPPPKKKEIVDIVDPPEEEKIVDPWGPGPKTKVIVDPWEPGPGPKKVVDPSNPEEGPTPTPPSRSPIITKRKQYIHNKKKYITIIDGTEEPEEEQNGGGLPDIINYAETAIYDNPALAQLPDLFPKMNNVVLKIQQPKTLVQLIQDGYSKDQIDLDKYYLQKLQFIMQKYFQQMMAIMADCGVSSMDDLTKDFDGDFVTIPAGKDLEHLRDFIVRSQVQRNQISRMFHKTHSTDKTLMHMRSWHAANEQRKRYYSEKYKDSTNFTESHSNSLLRESRSTYDSTYDASLYDMYKYLNSSVMITNDILDLTVKEAQAKAELLKNGVDIYAVDQSEVEFAKLATDSGQLGDGKGSGFDKDTSTTDKDKDKESGESGDKENSSDNKESDGDKKDTQATDEQYENDVKYLMDQGYDRAAADAELSKLSQYKERLGKKEEKKEDSATATSTTKESGQVDKTSTANSGSTSSAAPTDASSSTSSSGIWNDLAKSVLKNPLGKLTGAITNSKELEGIVDTNALGKVLESAVNATAQKVVKNIEKESQKVLSGIDIKNLIPKSSDTSKKAASKKAAAKDDQSKYPEYNRIDYENDSKIIQKKKRVAQIKQDIAELDNQIANIKKERQETGHSTARHNELVKASRSRSKLMQELADISS